MSDSTVKYPASLVPVGAFAGKPAMPLTRQMIVVGSSKHSRILLKSDTVSSVHTLLILSNGRWFFRDLVSRTHTILNGKSIREGELKNGDTITIGAFVFHFVAPEPKDPIIKGAPAALDITDAEIPVPIDTKTVLIGKRPGCEVRLMEEGVSPAHAVIFECNGVHYIRDLYSRGGTFLNGEKVHQEPLKFGDVLVVGETTIKYIPDRSVEDESANLLDESARPVILHDDPMASHDAPLVARDLPTLARHGPVVTSDEQVPSRPAKDLLPAAKAPNESTDAASDPRKPAEIRATLPPGLSSLLDTAGLTSADAIKPSAEFEARRDLLEPLPIDEADDLVVPLRRREPAEEMPAVAEATKPLADEVEPSSIAPDVDEVRPDVAASDSEPADEIDEPGPISADIDEAILVEEDQAIPADDVDEDAIPVADDEEQADALAGVGPAVANQPLEVEETPEVVAAEPVDVEIEPAAVETVSADIETDVTVDSIDLVDEVELSEATAVVPETHGPVEDVASTVVSLPPEPASSVEEPIDVETEVVATTDNAVVTRDEVVANETVTTNDVVAAEDAEDADIAEDIAASTANVPADVVPADEAPTAEPSPISKELKELAAEIEATLARAVAPPEIDRPLVETAAVEDRESPVSPLDVKVFAEQVRRDFAAEDAKATQAKDDAQLESEAEVEMRPQAETTREVELEPVAEVPAAPVEPNTASPLEVMEQSPELRQLADLQARIAAALEDPSIMTREPILPPGAPLVSDPDTAMNAAARRARLIAEMLEETEPIEEEAEREAKSISFDIDESVIPPTIEPITEVESPPIVAETPTVAEQAEALTETADETEVTAAVVESDTEADSLGTEAIASRDEDIDSVADEVVESSEAMAVEAVSAEEESASLANDEVSLAEDEVESAEQPLPAAEELSEDLAGETASLASTIDDQEVYDLNIDAADTLPADIARGDDVVAPMADLIAPEKVDAYPSSESVPNANDVIVTGFAMPSAVELSELPAFDAPAEVQFKSEAAPALRSTDLELPAPEALDAPLEVEEVEPTLQGSARDEQATRDQDVFDKASIAASAPADLEESIAEETPVDGALLATDEVRESGEILDEPVSVAPTLDASEPISESADDELAGEEIAVESVSDQEPLAEVADEVTGEVLEPVAAAEATVEPIEEPLEVEVEVVDAATVEAIEDEIFAQQDEKPELKVETPETTAELATQPDEVAVEVNDPIAPVEADEYNAGEVIITGVDVGPEAAPQDETPVEAIPTFELPPAVAETPVVAEPALTNDIATDRVILEAEEEEPLERQSRPLIAADEHLVEDDIEEIVSSAEPEVPATTDEPELSVDEAAETEVSLRSQVIDASDESLPTIEVDVTSAQIGEPFDQSSNPFAQETPAEVPVATAPLTPMEPIVAEGTVEAAKRPVMVADPSIAGIDKPRAMNIAVPSLDVLQAEFDDAFADALAMAEGKSFAGEPKPVPATENEKPFETAIDQEGLLEPANSQTADEDKSEKAAPPATIKPLGARQGNVVSVNVPPLEKLEADFRDSFAEALAMAEGQSFSKPKFEVRDKLTVSPAAQPAAEAPAATPIETPAPAKPARKQPEFKLDESLLDQAEKMGPVGGSPAPMGSAAFMNLGGIGWIGDDTLDDFEIVGRKPAKPKRRSRQRRPVGDQLSKPETTAEASVEPISPTSESFVESKSVEQASISETPADAEVADFDHALKLDNEERAPTPRERVELEPVSDGSAADEAILADNDPFLTEPTATADLDDLIAEQIDEDEPASAQAEESVTPLAEVDKVEEVEVEEAPRAIAAPAPLPTVIPPRPTRPRKGQAVVDEALSASSGSPFAAQELSLVDAFSGAATPQLDEVLARLNTSGGAVKDHPPISQDRPLNEGKEVKVPVSPFASQIPIAQPAGSVRRVRQRVSKLPIITGGMAILMLVSSLIWFIPVQNTVRGEVKFKNLERTTELVRKDMQRNILAKLPDVKNAARQQLDDFEGGFLDRDKIEAWDEIVRKAHFDQQTPNLLVLEVPSNVNQSKLDEKRLTAVIQEFLKANKDLSDEVNKMVDESREIERARSAIDTQLATVKKKFDELGVIYETGTITNSALKKVEKELLALDESRKQAAQELQTREAELKKLEAQILSSGIPFRGSWMRAVPGIMLADASGAVPSVEPIDATVELAKLQREREDLTARIDRLTAARSPETAAARESFDRALDAFSKQVEEARNTLGDKPEVLKYVQSATKLQDQIREMTDTLVRRQEQQITRLNEFQLKLKEHTQSAREQRITGDPQLKEWMDDLAFQERRLNVAKESNAAEEDVKDIERNISFLKSNIAAKQELLSDPSEVLMVRDIESMIEATKKDMAADRQRNDAVLAEVQNVFKSNQPVLEALPVEQRQVTQGLTERLAQIDLARQRYTDSLAVVAGSDDTLIADAQKQVELLDTKIAAAQTKVQQEALVHSQEMEKRTEIAKRVEEARAKVAVARAGWEDLDKQYRNKVEARDVLAAKVTDWKAAAADRDLLEKQKLDMEKRQGDLIVRRKAVEDRLAFAVVPDPAPKIHVLSGSQSDPRLKYFGFAMFGIISVGVGLMTMEVRNRIPVPQQAGDETSDSQTPPLSGTPTVA